MRTSSSTRPSIPPTTPRARTYRKPSAQRSRPGCRNGCEDNAVIVSRLRGPLEIRTRRFRLVSATAELLRFELDDPAAFAARLDARMPDDWPPGEYDRDAIQFFLDRTIAGGDSAAGWYGWYLLFDEEDGGKSLLVGCAGYLGPPDEAGRVEIGYSICEDWRGQGVAKEIVGGLVENAGQRGVQTVQAHANPENAASIAVLLACGFRPAAEEDSNQLLFAISR
ncbi:MAG: GNAT family N-acetyltransferase [Terracidiphilus sp.]|nr:GNAT family N-acetyltransferase [Terracidiphilus sp.]MDR3799412.1 GNAT family N-acetyltransferase [Terracidiphilus sp.]